MGTERLATGMNQCAAGFHHKPRDFRTELDLLSRGKVQVTPLISHRLPLDEIVEGFEIVANRRGRKVLIHCSGEA